MDKTARPHINARVGGYIALAKEHDITRTNAATGHRYAPLLQLEDRARGLHTGPRLVNMPYQPTAVKAGIRRISAIAVRCAHQAHGINSDVIGLFL